jgi:hypothetical protein
LEAVSRANLASFFLPSGVCTRTIVPFFSAVETVSNLPMTQDNSYVDILGDGAKTCCVLLFARLFFSICSVFANTVKSFSVIISKENIAFILGSSKQGNALLASMASNCVAPIISSLPL